MQKHRLQAKTFINKYVSGFWCEEDDDRGFPLDEALWTHVLVQENNKTT